MCAILFGFAKGWDSGEGGSVASYSRYFLCDLWQITLISSCLRSLSVKTEVATSCLKYFSDPWYDLLRATLNALYHLKCLFWKLTGDAHVLQR